MGALCLVLLALITGSLPVEAETSTEANASRHEIGRRIYNFRCYFCHGYSGDARTLASRYLTPPPRDFTDVEGGIPKRKAMVEAITHGRPGTAMMSFASVIGGSEIEAVVDFIRAEFQMSAKPNTLYHTRQNGWPDHDRHRLAFPYVTGEATLDAPWEELAPPALAGRRLFLRACITCHDAPSGIDVEPIWERDAISYPRFGFRPTDLSNPPDALSGATTFAAHDIRPVIAGLNADQRQGERLFQDNCAFCHAADGTGKNWIGRFMQPHARDLTDPDFMRGMTRAKLVNRIRDGMPGTSMPAWGSVLDSKQIEAVADYIDAALHPLSSELF